MAKVPMYALAWSPTTAIYELYQTHDYERLGIVLDSQEWFTWLEQVSSFAFSGKSGHYTARKEARQRGDRYWYAYLTTAERLTKKYLGKTADLTLARLEHMAEMLSFPSETQISPLVSLAASTNNEEDSTQLPILAQHDPLFPLLATKLFVPRSRAQLVSRARLVERLQQGLARPLTIVSAPAGFGKTTLLAQWLAQSDLPLAWLSLDAEDNDPTRFLSYLIASLQTLDAQLGTTALALLRTPQPAPPETVLTVLTNDLIEGGEGDIVLVLDDYHVITDESIQRGIIFLLEHLPTQLHLVLVTRADPPLPLAGLRARGLLTEVRTADLRFEGAEVDAFLQAVMGLDLEASAIATLERHTEGWIAGLQLAALSLQGRTDISEFLATFSGSHHYVLDYLSEEVLARQDVSVQQFLLHTCILDRLSGPLCDAVTAQEGSQAMLDAIERANLFVVALDDERRWYRYHHLFADMLRRHLQHAEPTLPPILHRRASFWYEQHELPAEAVQHALAVPDAELAARLIEPIAFPLVFQGQLSTVIGWLHALPEALLRTRPRLCVYYAVLLTFTNQLEAAMASVQEAERGIQKEVSALPAQITLGWVLATRAAIARFSGDIPQAVSLARQALTLLPEEEFIPRMGATVVMAVAYAVSGDVTPTSEHAVAAAFALSRTSGNLFAAVNGICLLARLYVLQGRLRHAASTFELVVQVVPRSEILHTIFFSIFYYFGMGDLLRECDNLEAAERYLSQGMALVKEKLTVEPFVAVLGFTALARLQQGRGNVSAAFVTLDALTHLAEQRHFPPHYVAQVAAARAKLELAQGNLAAAIRWADTSGLSIEDGDLPFPREGEYLALARVRIAQRRDNPASPFFQEVLHLLERLLKDAEEKERLGSVLEILIVQALALQAQGEWTSALSTLERALVLAAPEGYIRLFVDEGEPVWALLRHSPVRSAVPAYITTLLKAFGAQHLQDLPSTSAHPASLLDPLTEREREVLRLLLEGASNREIARRLVLSVNTVKRHVYNLSSKLGVRSRAQAIVRARELHLV